MVARGQIKKIGDAGSVVTGDDDVGPARAFQEPHRSARGCPRGRVDDGDVTMDGLVLHVSQCGYRRNSENAADTEMEDRRGHGS